jgi:hypothetical protein
MLDFNIKDCSCKKCKRAVNRFDLFTGDLCLDCYSKIFNKLTPEQQKPDFINCLNNK